ncbi:MAG: extracellular solute-binding protein [Sphaerochaetaceae bacterium]|nr:extracellular solute-binding protein [Sphaerochaetaceae bacterium]
MRKIPVLLCLFLMLASGLWAAGTAEDSGTVTIEFFQQKREVVDLFDELIADFEAKNPGIKVEQVHVADSGQVLMSRLASNDVPDLLTHWPNNTDYITASLEGYFLDLTDSPVAENAIQNIIESITLENGKNYCVPVSINTQGIFYNKALFEEYGLEIPKTWDEFVALCREIKGMGKLPLIFPDGTAWTLSQQLRMLLALDLDGYSLIRDVKAGKADARDNQDLRAMAEKLLFLRQFGQKNSLGTSYEQATFEFATGKSFMFWQGIWAIPSINKANPDLSYSMFPLPAKAGRETRVEYGVDLGLVIGNKKDAAKVEAAKKFVSYITSTEVAQRYADVDGSPSAIQGVKFNSDISAPLVDMVQQSKSFRNIRYLYAPGGNGRADTGTQQLILDSDVDAFLAELNYIFGKPE